MSTQTGRWVRPVTECEHGELYPGDFGVRGWEPKPLDVVRFSYSGPAPEPAQPENVLVEHEPWRLVRRLDPARAYSLLEPLLCPGPELLGNSDSGLPEEEADAGVAASLTLVEPEQLQFVVRRSFGNLKPRAFFTLGEQLYDLPVTDRVLKPLLQGKGAGTFETSDLGLSATRNLLTISLGQPFNNTNWKLVAGCIAVA